MNNNNSLWKTAAIGLGLMAYVGIAAATLTGCNTVEGAGKDVQKGGEKIERAADRNK